MQRIITYIFAIVAMLTLTTCEKDHMLDCFKSTGETISEFRDASDFSTIQLDDNVDLVIHPNTTPYIKVTAGENLIDGIITELSGGTLYIRNENRCNWMRSFKNAYTVEVGMDSIQKIIYYGAGDITCIDTIRTYEFFFEGTNGSGSINLLMGGKYSHINNHTGRTDIHLKGHCSSTQIYINDVGTLDGSDFQSLYAYVRNSSTGDIKLKVQDELGAEVLYNGNIFYSGNPAVTTRIIKGSGQLIQY